MDLSWLPDNGGTGHMPPSEDVINFWKSVKEKTNFKTLVEIGFNAGHSSSIMLTLFDDIKIKSYDIGQFDITKKNGIIVKEKFGDRFDLKITDSKYLTYGEINGSDLLFIDGGHDYPIVSGDISLWEGSNVPYVVIDDLQNEGVIKARDKLHAKGNVKILHEGSYYAVLPYAKRNKGRSPIKVNIELLERL
jgi:hypothetical protein